MRVRTLMPALSLAVLLAALGPARAQDEKPESRSRKSPDVKAVQDKRPTDTGNERVKELMDEVRMLRDKLRAAFAPADKAESRSQEQHKGRAAFREGGRFGKAEHKGPPLDWAKNDGGKQQGDRVKHRCAEGTHHGHHHQYAHHRHHGYHGHGYHHHVAWHHDAHDHGHHHHVAWHHDGHDHGHHHHVAWHHGHRHEQHSVESTLNSISRELHHLQRQVDELRREMHHR